MLLLIALALVVLAACGGDASDDDDDLAEVPPDATPVPASVLEETGPTEGPPPPPPPTYTPVTLPDESIFEAAAERARVDVAARLDVSLTEVEVLDADVPLLLDTALTCPEVAEDVGELYYVYIQHERFIYPYQFYELPEPDTETGDTLAVEACDDTLVDEEVLYVPTPNARADILALVEAELQAQGVDPTRGTFVTVRPMTWFDEALGCRLSAFDQEETTPAVIEGFLVVYELDDMRYEYHTDSTGARIEFCEQPIGYASIEAFVFTLKTKGEYDYVELEDQPARYDGLDADGLLVGLTPAEYRVGLFDFETPQAARLAAAQIDDEDVARIYVSGYVVIVQEENALEVYGILSQYAEEVRAPVDERQQALDATAQAEEALPDDNFPEDDLPEDDFPDDELE